MKERNKPLMLFTKIIGTFVFLIILLLSMVAVSESIVKALSYKCAKQECPECPKQKCRKCPIPSKPSEESEIEEPIISTNTDFQEFQEWFIHYQKKFGLSNWDVSFEQKEFYDRRCAQIITSPFNHTAKVELDNAEGCGGNKKVARHEAIHLLLNSFDVSGRDEEELVIKLTDLIE